MADVGAKRTIGIMIDIGVNITVFIAEVQRKGLSSGAGCSSSSNTICSRSSIMRNSISSI